MNSEALSVSVIIPVYNGAAFLAEAVQSVLRQTHQPREIIVVDDGSTDDSAWVVARFGDRVCYVYQPNSGPPAARNHGLSMAQGDVICFLDADDLWLEDTLATQLGYLSNHPDVDIVVGQTQRFWQTDAVGHPEIGHFKSRPLLSFGSAAIRRRVFARVGLCDETLLYTDDVDWFFRARERRISTLTHAQVVQLYRRHERNITNNHELNDRYFVASLRKSLLRRRQTDGTVIPMPPDPIYSEETTE